MSQPDQVQQPVGVLNSPRKRPSQPSPGLIGSELVTLLNVSLEKLLKMRLIALESVPKVSGPKIWLTHSSWFGSLVLAEGESLKHSSSANLLKLRSDDCLSKSRSLILHKKYVVNCGGSVVSKSSCLRIELGAENVFVDWML